MPQGNRDDIYDESLRGFIAEREEISWSRARSWQVNILAVFLALTVFTVGINLDGGSMADLGNELVPLSFDGEPIGLGILVWLIVAFALSFIFFGSSRYLYFSQLADLIASNFKPELKDLLETDPDSTSRLSTDLRRQFYVSYEHILARQFLEEEYREYHELEPGRPRTRGQKIGGFIRSLVEFFLGGRWISLDPRRSEGDPDRYRFMAALWPHGVIRSDCLGLFWSSVFALVVARAGGSHGLSNVFLLIAGIFFVIYFVQFIRFWGRVEKLSEGIQARPKPTPFACPECQAELTVGKNCEACGQPIDWGGMDLQVT
ncbi:MAG: hypothetical protein HXS50_04595 [Theionarchaea archaeon]|nr:hypothetical protein [Theionarchaea archaeon]